MSYITSLFLSQTLSLRPALAYFAPSPPPRQRCAIHRRHRRRRSAAEAANTRCPRSIFAVARYILSAVVSNTPPARRDETRNSLIIFTHIHTIYSVYNIHIHICTYINYFFFHHILPAWLNLAPSRTVSRFYPRLPHVINIKRVCAYLL